MLEGSALTSLGQSLDPLRLSQAMSNFQQLEQQKQQQQRFTQQLAQYEHTKKSGDQDLSRTYRKMEQMNPGWNNTPSSFQNYKAKLIGLTEAVNAVKGHSTELGVDPDEVEMLIKRIERNPNGAARMADKFLQEKIAYVGEQQAKTKATELLGTYESANIFGKQGIIRQAINDGLHINNPTAFAELSKLAEFSEDPVSTLGEGVSEDIDKTVGIQMLLESGELTQDQVNNMGPEDLAKFKDIEKLGEAQRLLGEMKNVQSKASFKSRVSIEENRRFLKESGAQIKVGNKNLIEVTDSPTRFKISMPEEKEGTNVSIKEMGEGFGQKVFIEEGGFEIAPESDGRFFVMKNGEQVGETVLRDLILSKMRDGTEGDITGESGSRSTAHSIARDTIRLKKSIDKIDSQIASGQTVLLDKASDLAQELESALVTTKKGYRSVLSGYSTRSSQVNQDILDNPEKLADAKVLLIKIKAIVNQAMAEPLIPQQ